MGLADETFPGARLFVLSLGTTPAAFGLTIASAAAVVDKVTGGDETAPARLDFASASMCRRTNRSGRPRAVRRGASF